MLLPPLIALALLLPADRLDGPMPAGRGAHYALLPLRNFTGDVSAPSAVVVRLRSELERRGAEFVPAEELEALLRERRIRYTDSMAAMDAQAIGAATGAQYVIAGALLDYMPGSDPRVAVALRALDTSSGRRVVSRVVSLRGADFEGLLGLGRIESIEPLLDEAAAILLDEFDDGGAPIRTASRERREHAAPPSGGHGFLADEFDPAAAGRLVVLPLEDRSGRSQASVYFAEFLGDAWFRSTGAQVVETSEVRRALISRKQRSMQVLDLANMADIGSALDVRYFVLGSIERWGNEVFADGELFPEVEVSLRLVDVTTGRMVGAAGVRRRGDHYQTVLGLGGVHDPLELARRTAAEIVAALGG